MHHTHLLYSWHEQDAPQTEKRTPAQFFFLLKLKEKEREHVVNLNTYINDHP
jgi:hypothetical protein